ncbi:hypothetical protein CNR22_03340 [Sphingobacteriaceae bacterium]|nr:hypothetical protein CNR22_03340 [Sphingobacteriaceae bacterium]
MAFTQASTNNRFIINYTLEGKGIYRNGFSDQQIECNLHLEGTMLHIFLQNTKNDLLIWNLKSLKSSQWQGSQAVLKFGPEPHQTIECEGPLAEKIYRICSGQESVAEPKSFQYKGIVTFGLIAFLILSLLVVLFIFYFLPWVGEKATALIPVETEVQIGENIAKVYEQQNELNDSATYYLNEFVKHLDLDETYTIDARVIESRDINAFALPGGKIFVYSGILDKMNSYEELVALLGHEVTHVTNRHSLKSICRSAATGIAISSIVGDANGVSSVVLSKASEFKQLDYSRELETEADDNGLDIMVNNKVSPKGMLDLLQLLKEENAEMPQYMKYLSTHPDTDSRIENSSKNPGVKLNFPVNPKLQKVFTKLKRCI